MPDPQGESGEEDEKWHAEPGRLVEEKCRVHAENMVVAFIINIGTGHMDEYHAKHGQDPEEINSS